MIGIYCRISKQKEQGKDVSIEVQKKSGINFAKSINEEFKIFIDEGISGTYEKINERKGFASLLGAIKNKEITKVYCYDQSRIERSNKIWNFFVSLMMDNKCLYYPSGKIFDLAVPENLFYTGVMSLAHQLYAALTGIKVKEAINLNAKKGKSHGLTAYGYKKSENGFLVINNEESEVVKRIFEMSLKGIGTYTIANILNSEQIPTKYNRYKGEIKRVDKLTELPTYFSKKEVKWRGNVLHDIITNPIYKGKRKWNNEEVSVPAIITEDLWQKVNDNLLKNKKKVGKREEYHYLLNGLIFCNHCNNEFRGKRRKNGGDNVYKCKSKSRQNTKCNSHGINIFRIETFIINHLFMTKGLEGLLTKFDNDHNEIENLNQKLQKAENALSANKKVEQNLYNALFNPNLKNDKVIQEKLISIKKMISNHEQEIIDLENQIIEKKTNGRVTKTKNLIGQYKRSLNFEETRNLIHSLVERITIEFFNKSILIEIKYKGFDESSIFFTDRNALKWYCYSHYRNGAITKEDLEDDKELYRTVLADKGITVDIPQDFSGFVTVSSGEDLSIFLKKEDLICFN